MTHYKINNVFNHHKKANEIFFQLKKCDHVDLFKSTQLYSTFNQNQINNNAKTNTNYNQCRFELFLILLKELIF